MNTPNSKVNHYQNAAIYVNFFSSVSDPIIYIKAETAQAGPVEDEEGLKALDAYLEWRRTDVTSVNAMP